MKPICGADVLREVVHQDGGVGVVEAAQVDVVEVHCAVQNLPTCMVDHRAVSSDWGRQPRRRWRTAGRFGRRRLHDGRPGGWSFSSWSHSRTTGRWLAGGND